MNECHIQAIRRLNETPDGAYYINTVVLNNPDGPMAWLFEPAEDDHKARELYEKWYPVARKSVTALVVGTAELGPQLMVTKKITRTRNMVRATLRRIYPKSMVASLEKVDEHLRKGILKLTPQGRGCLLEQDKLKQELTHWIDESKAHWPHGTKLAKVAEMASFALTLVEAYNLLNTINEVYEELSKQGVARRQSGYTLAMRILARQFRAPCRLRGAHHKMGPPQN